MAEATGSKRKKPPTFEHYPVNRAKKLKKAWVEKAKIKHKWKLEKRREGLVTPLKFDHKEQLDKKHLIEADEKDVLEERPSKPLPSSSSKSYLHPSRAHIHQGLSPHKMLQQTEKSQASKEPAPPLTKSLRELTKEAYSPASLHTFKAGSLKHTEAFHSRGRGGSVGRGRGQPNMKLRMGAMLEKIKQDLA